MNVRNHQVSKLFLSHFTFPGVRFLNFGIFENDLTFYCVSDFQNSDYRPGDKDFYFNNLSA